MMFRRWWLAGTLAALASSACGLGYPTRPDPEHPAGDEARPRRLYHAPPSVRHRADLDGAREDLLLPEEELGADIEKAALDADEAAMLGASKVPPILAQTGTVSFDIPISDDPRVGEWIEYLTGRGRAWYAVWLARSTRYVPIFWPILDQYGLPRDLVFLSMIESGFSPKAHSWAQAAGPWQFMPHTGQRYGLEVGFWVDERRDFEKATHAAAKYLRDLHREYGDWFLAWAAYNAGSGRVNRAIRNARSRDFWKISRTWHLKRETKHYVPKLIAAAIIAKQPERFGFSDVEYLPPEGFDRLELEDATGLAELAVACGELPEEELRLLNPELRMGITPPGRRYAARVPAGRAERCRQGLEAMAPEVRLSYRYHRMGRGETLAAIASRHSTTPEAIAKLNHVDEKLVREGDELVVPVPWSMASTIAVVEPVAELFRPLPYGPDGAQVLVHGVRPGDSLWRIARRYRVTVRNLRLWNGLWGNSSLRVGQKLKIYRGAGGAPGRGVGARPR